MSHLRIEEKPLRLVKKKWFIDTDLNEENEFDNLNLIFKLIFKV